ncbi:muscarinic acetylcholine receptor M3-like [Liolophura sinensis]|uniref:muscarinic acetylcholine receptor M3-like n=1 Tax=Liolophura sinensis TaxID=3198878 RepID=UPI0031598997
MSNSTGGLLGGMSNSSQSSENNTVTTREPLTTDKIIICVVFYIIVFVTIFGNVLVLLAIKVEKRLQTLFNYYIINLAVTDIAVAVTAMSFYTLDVTLGYWPFGEIMCAIWIFCDYGMTFASVFTLIAISLDRFWSVTWSLHYRTHHTRKKCLIIIAVIWLFMVILWLPPCVLDRIQNSQPEVCIWEPSLNREFVIVIAAVGHHGAFLLLMFCYIRVLLFMRKRQVNPVIPRNKNISASPSVSGVEDSVVAATSLSVVASDTKSNNLLQPPKSGNGQSSAKAQSSENSSGINKERKVFVTLTYIIVGYVMCWLPFHIVFDVSSIAPEKVPNTVYTITFWMTYLNSTINPFLYNFSSKEFRQAFKKILSCAWRTT